MRRARRTLAEPRLELTPLLDVMFLLLTFFIFAFVLMVRLEVTDIRLPTITGGQSVQNAPAIAVAIRSDGSFAVSETPTPLDQIPDAIDRAKAAAPTAQLLIAVDQRAPAGEVFRLMDTLRAAGHTDLRFLRAPNSPDSPAPPPAPSSPSAPNAGP